MMDGGPLIPRIALVNSARRWRVQKRPDGAGQAWMNGRAISVATGATVCGWWRALIAPWPVATATGPSGAPPAQPRCYPHTSASG